MTTSSVPSFNVFAFNIIGKVTPPSIDNLMFTFWQFIGATSVVPLFQVTVCVEPTSQDTAELGAETTNASASVTLIYILSLAVLPPPA